MFCTYQKMINVSGLKKKKKNYYYLLPNGKITKKSPKKPSQQDLECPEDLILSISISQPRRPTAAPFNYRLCFSSSQTHTLTTLSLVSLTLTCFLLWLL